MKNRLVGALLSVLAGAVITFAFAPWYLWWCAPLGLALTFAIARRAKVRAYQYVFLSTLTLEVIHLHWTSVYVGSAPWLVLALGEAIFFTLPFLFWRSGSRAGFFISWLAGEWLIARAPYGGFGWSRIGFIGNGPTLNLAYWGGPTLIVMANLLLAFLIHHLYIAISRGERTRGVSNSILIALSVLLLPLVPMAERAHTSGITLSGVQGNVPRLGLDFNAQREAVLRNHARLTLESPALSKSALVVWPENASDVDPLTQPAKKLIEETSQRVGTPILLGGVSRRAGSGLRNITLWVDPTLGIDKSSIYTKRHLAPFGEYLPLRKIAELMTPAARRIEDMTPGSGEVRYRVSGATIAPVICFEVLDDPLLAEKSSGAGVLVIQTNSATFGTTPESLQQLAISRVRSIEHGRPILSISTSGVSAFITSDGRISQQTDIYSPAVITQEVFPDVAPSPADTIPGGSANALTGAMLLVGLSLGALRRRTRRCDLG